MEKSWAWWYMPMLPATVRSIKEENQSPGQLEPKVRQYLSPE
jgi:hypothetical protein